MKAIVSLACVLFFIQPAMAQGLCAQEEEAIINLVSQFEEYQQDSDAIGVLNLFTPPDTEEEESIDSSLRGLDIVNTGASTRLYHNVVTAFSLRQYEIVSLEQVEIEERIYCAVNLEEQRVYYTRDDGDLLVGVLVTHSPVLVLSLVGDLWRIEKYATDTSAGKYSAWGN